MAWSFEAKIIETIFNALEAVICLTAVYSLYEQLFHATGIESKCFIFIQYGIWWQWYWLHTWSAHICTVFPCGTLEYDLVIVVGCSQSHLNPSDFRFTSLSNARCSLCSSHYITNKKQHSFRQVIDIMFFACCRCCWTGLACDETRVFFVPRCVRLNDVILSESVNHSSFSFMTSNV